MSQVALPPFRHHRFGAALELLARKDGKIKRLSKLGADRTRLKPRAHHQAVTIRQDGPDEVGAFPFTVNSVAYKS